MDAARSVDLELTAEECAYPEAPYFPHSLAAATPEVFYSKEITTETVLTLLDKVRGRLTDRVAINLHSGEPNGPNILPRDLVRAVRAAIPDSRLVGCNVLHGSPARKPKPTVRP